MPQGLSAQKVCWWGSALVAIVISPPCWGQTPPDPNYQRQPVYDSYDAFRTAIYSAANIANPVTRAAELDSLFITLQDAGQIPFAIDGRAAFLYRGGASSVSWRGDFNGWGETAGQRIGSSDVWILEQNFPADARTDYKLFLNGFDWRLDPRNPLQQWGGLGPNSELRMPEYVFPQETVRRGNVPRGTITANTRISSQKLDYDINYRVYTPAGYDEQQLHDLPTLYVTDGQEYLAEPLGALPIVMDNLIADGAIRPAIAIFIDPRDPDAGSNRRAEQYLANFEFADFVADELVPVIDASYRTAPLPERRTILGTSYGGFNSAFVGVVKGELFGDNVFGNIALQSPVLVPELIDLYRDFPLQSLNIFMSGGTFGDDLSSDAMAAVLAANGYSFEYLKVNDGHSWGAWRGQLDDMLIAMVGGARVPEPSSLLLAAMVGFPLAVRLRRHSRVT